jgi:hypothetical protein
MGMNGRERIALELHQQDIGRTTRWGTQTLPLEKISDVKINMQLMLDVCNAASNYYESFGIGSGHELPMALNKALDKLDREAI